ncbi:MAG: threonine synthase [Alphaproteobacteria bacterium]|nr:threonine synthase [Alphaproteobacteria bacterium]
MKYISTRGAAPSLAFPGVTLTGLAADGGLYVPEACPQLSGEDIANMAHQNYVEVAWRVMAPFIGNGVAQADLVRILKDSYGVFEGGVAPIKELSSGFYLMELFHGPTLAFKDVAMQFLGHVFDHLLKHEKKKITIVGATSGDTGSAAIHAFAGKDTADIFILHPKGRVSDVQRRQMTTVHDANVRNIAIEGSFDDCQNLVKALFADETFRAEKNLSAVNSINWARILAQVVYYVYASARIRAETHKPVTFCVPTGNFGNIYAGYVAKSMGAPVDRLITATNANDILYRFFTTGRMKQEGVVPTLSPSMDIQVSSNFERLLFDVFGRRPEAVAQTMIHFAGGGAYHLEDEVMEGVRAVFGTGRCGDNATKDIIGRYWRDHQYLVDPHTAVGLAVAEDDRKKHPDSVYVTLATAHPAKFPDAVRDATGETPDLPAHMSDIFTREEKYETLSNDLAAVKDYIRKGAG